MHPPPFVCFVNATALAAVMELRTDADEHASSETIFRNKASTETLSDANPTRKYMFLKCRAAAAAALAAVMGLQTDAEDQTKKIRNNLTTEMSRLPPTKREVNDLKCRGLGQSS